MIYDQPRAADLLHEARRELIDEIFPDINPKARYKLLMINRAMELAEQELDSNHEIENELENRLKCLVEDNNTEMPVADILKQQLRNGQFDSSETLYEILQLIIAFKLRVTNPAKLSEDLGLKLDNLLAEQTTSAQ